MKIFRTATILLFSLFLVSCAPQQKTDVVQKVSIAYAEPLTSFSPLNYSANNRKYLSNIYETLVRYDKTFSYDSGLAVSWGRFDDLTWEFHLRPDVLFQNGDPFRAEDAVYSLQTAMTDDSSQLKSLLSNIDKVEKIDDYKIHVITKKPDPLLLNKLINVYIFPSNYTEFTTPIGTGPYFIKSSQNSNITLGRFDSYWGSAPYFEEAYLTAITDPEKRLTAILTDQVQVLANVPPQYVSKLEEAEIGVQAFPNLEVSSVMFNFKSIFADQNLREAVYYALSTDYADKFGAGYLLHTDQFSASGMSGYSRKLIARNQNVETAKQFREKYIGDVNVTLDVPTGLEKLAEQIKTDLADININVTVLSLSPSDFQNKILSGESDFYFFGWKYDLADVSDFFETVVHSQTGEYGSFNGMGYSSTDVDEYIEQASQLLNVTERQDMLSLISKRILDDRIGVPIFESELLYGVRPEVIWDIRLDGQILASEIVGKGV